jgi:copper resistance protein C
MKPIARTHRRLLPALATGAVAALALIGAGSVTATAHNDVVSTTPADGETVTSSPVEIQISTSDQLLDISGDASGFAIVVQDAAGLYYSDGCVSVNETSLVGAADLGEAGDYQVTYQFVSADGHTTSDSFGFTFAPAEDHTPVPGKTTAPVCGVAEDGTEAISEEAGQPLISPAPTGEDAPATPDPSIITVAIAAVLVVLSIVLLVWMVRRKNGN